LPLKTTPPSTNNCVQPDDYDDRKPNTHSSRYHPLSQSTPLLMVNQDKQHKNLEEDDEESERAKERKRECLRERKKSKRRKKKQNGASSSNVITATRQCEKRLLIEVNIYFTYYSTIFK